MSIMKSLQLNNIVVVFDQALYAKAAEVTWKRPETFKNIILRMGVFHATCNFMGTIGKRFADAGLRDLCVEAGVIADGSITGVLDGHRYNRAIRLHKLLYEAFLRLAWKGFRPWLEENHPEDLLHLEETLQEKKFVFYYYCLVLSSLITPQLTNVVREWSRLSYVVGGLPKHKLFKEFIASFIAIERF